MTVVVVVVVVVVVAVEEEATYFSVSSNHISLSFFISSISPL